MSTSSQEFSSPGGDNRQWYAVHSSVDTETVPHKLFTQTLKELADIETADALERQEKEKCDATPKLLNHKPALILPFSPSRHVVGMDKKQAQLEEDGLEDDLGLVEKATIRDRNWDDWKDDHQKGSGNKGANIF